MLARALLAVAIGLLTGALAFAWSGSSLAQYREGTPEVLTPAPSPDEAALFERDLTDRFAEGYSKQGRPRIAIFWNRQFSDRFSQWVVDTRDIEAKEEFKESTGPAAASRTVEGFYQERLVPEPTRRGLQELPTFQFESGYMAPLLASGVAVFDRAAIMRLTQREQDRNLENDRVPDIQALETDSLIGHADLLVELLMTPQPTAPLGVTFQVTVKNIQTGRVITAFVSGGEPVRDSRRRWKAGRGGFRLDQAPNPGPEDVGRALALETMETLAAVWR